MNNISWPGYWITIALLAAIYYLAVYLLYFRKKVPVEGRLGSQANWPSSSIPSVSDSTASQPAIILQSAHFDNPDEIQTPGKDTIEHTVYACLDEINAYLEEAKRGQCIKGELLYALHTILRKYPAIAASEYKESLTNVIINQCEHLCSVYLSADDAVRLWEGW